MSSFDSVKGPSMTLRFEPRYLIRQPFEVGCKPVASRRTPAFASSSWYAAIASNISHLGMAPASVSFVALTMIMNRMFFLLLVLGSESPVGSALLPVFSTDATNRGGQIRHLCKLFLSSLRHCKYS